LVGFLKAEDREEKDPARYKEAGARDQPLCHRLAKAGVYPTAIANRGETLIEGLLEDA